MSLIASQPAQRTDRVELLAGAVAALGSAGGGDLLDAVIESIPAGIAIVDAASGGIVRRNATIERLLAGPGRDGLPRRPLAHADALVACAVHPDGRPYAPHEHPLARALERGEVVIEEETRHRFADGSEGHLALSAAPIRSRDGAIDGGIVTAVDVSERVRALQAMQEAELRLERALATTSTAVWEWDSVERTTRFFGRLEEMHGLDVDVLSDFPARAHERVHPDDLQLFLELVSTAIEERGSYRVQHRLLVPGHERWIESRATAVELEPGRVVLRGVTRDIDREKRSDLAAAEADALYRLVLDNSTDIISLLDREGRYVLVSRSHERLLGYRPDDLVGRRPVDLVHPADLAAALADYDSHRGADGRRRIGPHRIARADGSWAVIESTVVPIRADDGRTRMLLVTSHDLSRTAEHAAALEASEARFRVLFEHAPLGISLLDTEGRWLTANSAFRELVGYSLDELGELTLTALAEDDHRDAADALIAGALAQPDGRLQAEARLLRRDGRPVWAWLSAAVVAGAGGAPAYVIAMAQDITARKELEEQLRQAQRMESVGRLAGGIAHDFNNLLTVVTGYAGLLLERLAGTPHERQLEQVAQAASRGAALTSQLLAFSRQQVLKPRLVDLDAVVSGTSAMLELLVGEDVRMVRRPSPEPLPVLVDPGQVEQVLVNLVVNARDAMPEGGSLVVETRPAELDAPLAGAHPGLRPGRYALLVVSDTGTGMDEETLARAFDPFFSTKGAAGTGLGLSTVHGIVHQSGGAVFATSAPGRGTTFEVYLPLAEGTPSDAPDEPDDTGTLEGDETVLLVEDEEELRALLCTLLDDLGYTVHAAGSAEEAAALLAGSLRDVPVHLLLTDVVLTGMSGRRLAQRMQETHPDTRILLMSGYTGATAVLPGEPEQQPGTPFLPKPFTAADLARYVRRAIEA